MASSLKFKFGILPWHFTHHTVYANNDINLCIIDGEDYSGNTVTIIVSAGVTMQSLAVNIIDNDIVECNEIFNVTIVSVTTCGVTIGSNNIGEVMIRDDDGKHRFIMIISVMSENIIWWIGATVSLSQSQYSVVESNNSLTGTITLSSRASEDVIVEVTISDGSANGNVE